MKKILFLVLSLLLFGCADDNINNIDTDELTNYLTTDYTLLDVRTIEEYEAGHIAGFINLDFYQFSTDTSLLDRLDKDKPIVLICRSGNRSSQAAKLLTDLGFKEVYNVTGGMNTWTKETV